MNLSEQSAKKAAVLAPLSSNWIEIFAVPIASAVMETQPIMLVLPLLVPRFFGVDNLLDTVSITGLMLYFQWWAMFVGRFTTKKQRSTTRLITRYDLSGMLLGLLLFAVFHIALLSSIPTLVVVILLSAYFWKRGKDHAYSGLNGNQLIIEFKIGFGVVVFMLLVAFLSFSLNDSPQSAALSLALPIYFLAGVIALSLTRIGKFQQESARHPATAQKETTNGWILSITWAWVLLVIGSIALESLPAQLLVLLLSPLLGILNWLAQGLLYIFGFLFLLCILFVEATKWVFTLLTSWFFHTSTTSTASFSKKSLVQAGSNHSNVVPLWLAQVGVGIIVLCVIIWFILFMQRYATARRADTMSEEDETREKLNRRNILKERRHKYKLYQEDSELEDLNPISVRARYRDFLLSMAAKEADMVRQDYETPTEYQQRLLVQTERQPSQSEGSSPPDFAILTELTQAYGRERYGGKELENDQHNYLKTWVPLLVQRLAGKNTAHTPLAPTAQHSTRKASRKR